MRLPVKSLAPLAIVLFIAGCGQGGSLAAAPPAPAETTGPAADYPVVVGDPFTIDGVTYKPQDRLSYDDVGYASVWLEGGSGISAAHKTLPLPSYAEVTSLETGRTILVRVERRGPMTNDRLIELSPNAAMQLGLTGDAKTAVRVRRVNPPEPERAALRSGQPAPPRMDTPRSLLAVLLRKLDGPGEPVAAASEPAATPGPAATPPARAAKPPRSRKHAAPAPDAAPSMPARPAPASHGTASGNLVVQVASFSSRANADRAAARLGGQVEAAGPYFRVRLGRYASQGDAAAALAKAKAAGYSDARIQRAN